MPHVVSLAQKGLRDATCCEPGTANAVTSSQPQQLQPVNSHSWILRALGTLLLPAELLAVTDSGEGQSLPSAVYSIKVSKFMATMAILVKLHELQKGLWGVIGMGGGLTKGVGYNKQNTLFIVNAISCFCVVYDVLEGCMNHGACVIVRGQLCEVSSLLPIFFFI